MKSKLKSRSVKSLCGVALLAFMAYSWMYESGKISWIPKERAFADAEYDRTEYNCLRPIYGDRVFVTNSKYTFENRYQYVVDLKNKEIVGRLNRGQILAYSREFSSYLCAEKIEVADTLPKKVLKIFNRSLPKTSKSEYRIFLLSEKTGEVKTLCKVDWYADYGILSPGGRYYQVTERDRYRYKGDFLVDFKEEKIVKIPPVIILGGGWWSECEFVGKNCESDIAIYNVETNSVQSLTTNNDLLKLISKEQDSFYQNGAYSMQVVWTGNGYEFLLWSLLRADKYAYKIDSRPDDNWLVRIDRPSKKLQLLDEDFPFHKGGVWNADLSLYLYGGEEQTGDASAVYIMDTKTKRVKTLFLGEPNAKYYSSPSFYNDRIIFLKQKSLWMMDVDGGNQERIFP